MKKLLKVIFIISIFSSLLLAQNNNSADTNTLNQNDTAIYNPYMQTPDSNVQYGYGVPLSSLPKNTQDFIAKHFKNVEVSYIERDWEDIEVYLANGTQIDFFPNGEWKEVKSYGNMPTTILPANVLATVNKTYPQAAIIKIEKQFTIYEVKLNNMMELYIDSNGSLLGQQFDD
ncbi:PepSY-like domain-containing protein [Brachyspira pilosicoli]|uniref:PepSY-like domain-containing protein n=1 Tax=Brachyspira pilosicoli TaxID=52584 RepID=UPI0030062F66